MTRPALVSSGLGVIVAAAMQTWLYVFGQVSVAAAAVVAGVVLGMMARPGGVREVTLPAAVIGVGSTVAAMAVFVWRGAPVLEGRFLVGWVATALIGAILAGIVAWGVGRVAALAGGLPDGIRAP